MALRQILTIGEPTLTKISRHVDAFDDRLRTLLDDMAETMFKADGVGLAAPQVGVLKRVCVISEDLEKVYEFVNPTITAKSGEQVSYEGCLSIPNHGGEVIRPLKVTVKAQNRYGKEFIIEAEGRLATIVCHELDHLDGILFVDRVKS